MTETKGYYSVVGCEGQAEWHKDIVQQAWRLYDAAIDLVFPEHSVNNIRLDQYTPAKNYLGFAVTSLEAKQTDEALYWFGEAIAASVDVIQIDQIKSLVKRIKGE